MTLLDSSTAEAAPEGAPVRPQRRFSLPAWTGLAPFFVFAGGALMLPIAFVCFQAFRHTTTGTPVRNPVTQQFETPSHTSFTFANLHDSWTGANASSLMTSVRLSAITAVIAAILGLALAYAVVNSRKGWLRQLVATASAVTANFGGIPLAFIFIATLDANAGVFAKFLQSDLGISLQNDLGFQLAEMSGITVVYLYFLIPLMVLVIMPALEGLKPQWSEAAENLGATRWQYLRWVAAPIVLPSFLGSLLLLFCASFSAYATTYALNSSFPIVTITIKSVLSGNVLAGQQNLGAALALDMIAIVLPLTLIYQLLQRRTSRWLQ